MATAATVTVDIGNLDPFGRIRLEVGTLFDAYVDKTSVHFNWLGEILQEAKASFQKPEVELLPKTPSEKRKRGRPKRGSVQKRESSAKKRVSNAERKARQSHAYLEVKAAFLGVNDDGDGQMDEQGERSAVTDDLENIMIPVPVLPPMIVEEAAEEEEQDDAVEEDGGAGNVDPVANVEDNAADQADAPESVEMAAIVTDVVTQSASTEDPDVQPEEEDTESQEMVKTPEPVARKVVSSLTAQKSMLPVPTSGTKEKFATPSILTPRITPTHGGHPMINRCRTPQKSAVKPSTAEAHDRLNNQLCEAKMKREELLRQKIEEQKKKREIRACKVAQQRLLQKAKEEEIKRKIEEKYTTPAAMDIEEKRKLRPRYPESSAKKPENNERAMMMEREKAKEKERIQREQEEMHRLKQVEEERHYQKAPIVQASTKEAGTSKGPNVQATALPQQSQGAVLPKNTVFHQAQDATGAQVVVGKPKLSRETFVVTNPSVASANTSSVAESYDMTPLRQAKPATATNYDISDLRSSDETDDEEHPRKKIPAWAQGGQLKMALTQQYYSPPDLDDLFGVVIMPDLAQMFRFQRKRFFKRTSSAKWDSPIHPHAQVKMS